MATLTTSWQMLAQTYLGSSHGDLYVRLYARYSEQDIVNNRSYVYFQARAYFSGSWIRDNQGSGSISGSLATVSGACTYPTNGETTIATNEGWIYHAADGGLGVLGTASLSFPNWGWSATASEWASLPAIPREATIKTAPDFNDEENPTITYSNPAGNSVTKLEACISLTGAIADVPYREISKTGNSYTFNLTEEERNTLRNATTSGSDSRDVHFFLATTIGSTVYRKAIKKTFRVINCEPTLEPTVTDEGDTSYSATGNRNILLRYFNYPKATFNSEAKKGASIISRTVTCGNDTKIADDGDWVQFNNVSDNVFIFTVRDNRGNEVSKPVTKDMINYVTLTCRSVITTDLSNNNTADINIDVSGKYYKGSLGKIDNNLTVEYRYGILNGTFGSWTQIPNPTVTGDEYLARATISNLDYKGTYVVQTRAKDAIYTDGTLAKEEIIKIVPTFDWGENDFNFNVPVFNKGNPMGYYPIGGICTSHENINPGELFGGTWELIRPFYGGELLAYSTTWNTRDSETRFMQDSSNGFSDIFAGDNTSNHICNYMPDILTKSSGTIWVQTKGVVGLVEVNVEIGGHSGTGCHGIWFKMDNKNALPQSVVLTGGSFQGLYTDNNKLYSGTSCRYFYNIADDDTGSNFFVNPIWTPYGGNFQACSSGIKSFLHVKAYAKGVTNYVWKRIA